MKEIDIVFTKSKKRFPIGSFLIRLWTGKEYSHVSRRKNILGEIMYYQSNEQKVNYEHEAIFLKKHEIVKVYTLEVPDNIERYMAKACLHESGRKYALMQNLGIALVDLFNLFNIKIDNPWKEGRNCSELIYLNVLKSLYPDLDYNPDTIKPHHIEQILIDRGNINN